MTNGATLNYTITVQNLGPASATNVTINDNIPASLVFNSANAPAGWTLATPAVGASGGIVTASIATLTVAGGQVIALQFTVHPATSHGTLTNTAVATASNPDLVPANNTATAVTDVILGPTPVTSNLPNAAVPTSSTGVPMAIFGFAALLFGLLSVPAVVSVRRNRPDQPLIPAGRHD